MGAAKTYGTVMGGGGGGQHVGSIRILCLLLMMIDVARREDARYHSSVMLLQ